MTISQRPGCLSCDVYISLTSKQVPVADTGRTGTRAAIVLYVPRKQVSCQIPDEQAVSIGAQFQLGNLRLTAAAAAVAVSGALPVNTEGIPSLTACTVQISAMWSQVFLSLPSCLIHLTLPSHRLTVCLILCIVAKDANVFAANLVQTVPVLVTPQQRPCAAQVWHPCRLAYSTQYWQGTQSRQTHPL